MKQTERRHSMGAEVRAQGVDFRVWAPAAATVRLRIAGRDGDISLQRAADGYWSVFVDDVGPGALYSYLAICTIPATLR